MNLANIAWQEVDTTTIRNCWHKASIMPTMDSPTAPTQPSIPISSLLHTPSNDQDPPVTAEDALQCALDDLERTGVLQKKNGMDINELLNLPEESRMMDDTTVKEICQAVLAAHKAQEEGLISGEGNDVEDDAPGEPVPTYSEIAQAMSIVARGIEYDQDPAACKLEVALASYGHQMWSARSQALTTTQITNYFSHT